MKGQQHWITSEWLGGVWRASAITLTQILPIMVSLLLSSQQSLSQGVVPS